MEVIRDVVALMKIENKRISQLPAEMSTSDDNEEEEEHEKTQVELEGQQEKISSQQVYVYRRPSAPVAKKRHIPIPQQSML